MIAQLFYNHLYRKLLGDSDAMINIKKLGPQHQNLSLMPSNAELVILGYLDDKSYRTWKQKISEFLNND